MEAGEAGVSKGSGSRRTQSAPPVGDITSNPLRQGSLGVEAPREKKLRKKSISAIKANLLAGNLSGKEDQEQEKAAEENEKVRLANISRSIDRPSLSLVLLHLERYRPISFVIIARNSFSPCAPRPSVLLLFFLPLRPHRPANPRNLPSTRSSTTLCSKTCSWTARRISSSSSRTSPSRTRCSPCRS